MKVTALISDELIADVQKYSEGKNITESITIALKYYLDHMRLNKAFDEIDAEPLQFNEDFTAYGIRQANRNR